MDHSIHIFLFFSLNKIVCFIGIQTWIIWVEGEHADHLTTTTTAILCTPFYLRLSQLLLLLRLRSSFVFLLLTLFLQTSLADADFRKITSYHLSESFPSKTVLCVVTHRVKRDEYYNIGKHFYVSQGSLWATTIPGFAIN